MAHLLSGRTPRRPRVQRGRGQAGIGMATTMIAVTIVFAMAAVWLAMADQATNAASYERRRQQSIDAANAGLVVAAATLGRSLDYVGTPLTDVSGGSAQYEVSLTTSEADESGLTKVITSVGYAPSKVSSGKVARTLQQVVKLVPQLGAGTFPYAIQSGQGIQTGAASTITGDIYAEQAIVLGNANTMIGSVFGQNNVTTGANLRVLDGTIWSMAEVNVTSPASNINGSIKARGAIKLAGTVTDSIVSMSYINEYPVPCSRVGDTCAQYTFVEPVPVQTLPTFTYEASNYPGLISYPTGEAMVAALADQDFSGTYYADSNTVFAKNQTWYLTGDTTILVKGHLWLPGKVVNQSPGGETIELRVISTESGDITPTNNLTIPATIPTLLYGGKVGSSSPTNSITMDGAIAATDLTLGARFQLTYKPVTAVAGFTFSATTGTIYIVRNISTREIPST